jgi:hypothetical protein
MEDVEENSALTFPSAAAVAATAVLRTAMAAEAAAEAAAETAADAASQILGRRNSSLEKQIASSSKRNFVNLRAKPKIYARFRRGPGCLPAWPATPGERARTEPEHTRRDCNASNAIFYEH